MGGGGCTTVNPVNYFANDNLVPMVRPNKRGREAESISNNISIQRQHQLQMSLNYNHSVQEEALKENLVSTGLRLSYDDEERNSSVTSASGSIVAASPFSQSLDDSLRIHLHRQKNELDQFLKIQVLISSVYVLSFALKVLCFVMCLFWFFRQLKWRKE